MRKVLLIALVACGLAVAQAQATMVVGIGGVGMDATFGPGGGLGTAFSINEDNNYPGVDFIDGTSIFVDFSDGTTDAFGAAGALDSGLGDFILTGLVLTQDNSVGGLASGVFTGGQVVLRDEMDNDLFTANVDQLVLTEVAGLNILSGSGIYSSGVTTVPGADPLPSQGGVVNVTFDLDVDIQDFSTAFTAFASMDFVPEPATLAFLALGGLALIRRR